MYIKALLQGGAAGQTGPARIGVTIFMKKFSRFDVGFLASGLLGLFGYLLGAPVEAVIVLILMGTAVEYLISRGD